MDLSNDADQKLWDELASGREEGDLQAASVPPAKELESTPEPDAAANAAAEQTSNEAANTEPTPAPTAATAAAAAKPDPVAELAEKMAKLEGQLRNVSGHIGGLNDGQKQLREMLTAANAATAAVKDAPTQQQVKEAMQSPEEWETLKKDFPEWSDATEKFLDAKLAGLSPSIDPAAIDRIVAERVAKETAAVRSEAVDAHLDGIVDGDWREQVKTEDFNKWMQGQPDDIQALGESAKLTDAARMLRLFVKSKEANPAQQIMQQRSAKLDAAAGVPRGQKAPRSKSPDDMTPEELWAHLATQTDKRLRG